MANIHPYAGKSVQRLTQMLNEDGGTSYVHGTDLTFGASSAYTDSQGRNTRTVVHPADHVTFPKDEYVRYIRLDLAVLGLIPGNVYPVVQVDALPLTIHSILDKINEALGLDLEPSEVVNEEHRSIQSEYPLKIADSIAWLPGTVFNFKVDAGLSGVMLLEDGTPMLLEDGTPMLLESAVV